MENTVRRIRLYVNNNGEHLKDIYYLNNKTSRFSLSFHM